MRLFFRVVFLLVAIAAVVPDAALAYGGPGSVISGIGALLAAVAAILASLFGFIWFPLKRLYQSMTEKDASSEETATGAQSE
jgi:succinate-acetate transporter protein